METPINLDLLSNRELLTAVYIGYYDRAPDPEGIAFWEGVLDSTSLDLEGIATDFSTQPETAATHPFFADPTSTSPSAFITSLYQNLFNRDPETGGLEFWTAALQASVDGDDGALPIGEIILSIISGAKDVEGGTQDRTTILNKIEAGLDWADTAAMVDGFDFDADAMANASSVIDGVTDSQGSVEAAKSATDSFFDPILNPPVEGQTFNLVIGEPTVTGTDGDDQFNGFLGQNMLGGVANTLSSASNIDGGKGTDRLEVHLTDEFTGAGVSGDTDVQPRIREVEEIDIQARDGDSSGGGMTFDAKDVRDVVEIGSYFSDGELNIENLTTLTSEGNARNTSAITIAMDHTSPFNSNNDASDLTVYFDNDYLINDAPEDSGATLTIELMDLDAETLGQDPLLDNPFGLITFTFGGEPKTLDFGTDSNTYAELLADIQQALVDAAATDSDFAQLTASFGPDFVVQDTDLDPNPAQPDLTGRTIVITNSGPEELQAVTMQATGVQPAGKDFHTGFGDTPANTEEFPITVNIDLHKAGRGGDGGNLIVGGKALSVSDGIAPGIEVFNVNVLGEGDDTDIPAGEKPSNIGTLTSTLGALREVYIRTDEAFVDGDSFASLEIRDGFNTVGETGETGDLQLVDANGFFGDLFLGTTERIINLDDLTALGGGDVTFNALYDGQEAGDASQLSSQAYTVLTGAGADTIDIFVDADSLDFAGSSLEVKTGSGDDSISVETGFIGVDGTVATAPPALVGGQNEQLNQAVLDNVDIDGEDGDDVIDVDGLGNANIHGGSGNDVIYTDGNPVDTTTTVPAPGNFAIWALNFDNTRVDDFPGGLPAIAPDEIPGVQTSLAYLDGATITVTLSGAGTGNAAAGGGVMAVPTAGAVQGVDGYEGRHTITSLNNGNSYYGDQTDISDGVKAAIENSVLNDLLTVTMGPNNTLLISSKTSGDFSPEDLRIDIVQNRAGSLNYANAVLDEAREEFNNSALTLTDLWGATTFATDRNYQPNDGTNGDRGDANLATSTLTNEYYDGLSRRGGDNELDDNLHTEGDASNLETDNVIDGGIGNDVIVLSTDSVPNDTLNYTPGGNNSMLDGTSNETVVFTGGNFGLDTVMNFTTTGDATRSTDIMQTIGTISIDTQGADPVPAGPESFTLDVSLVPPAGADYTINFDGFGELTISINSDPATVAADIAAFFADTTNYTAVINPADNEQVIFTAKMNGNVPNIEVENFNAPDTFDENAFIADRTEGTLGEAAVAEVFTVQFADSNVTAALTFDGTAVNVLPGDTAASIAAQFDDPAAGTTNTAGNNWEAENNGDGSVTFTSLNPGALADVDPFAFNAIDGLTFPGQIFSTIPAGIDFLDFRAYLPSFEDESVNGAGSSDSDVSNTMIPVTLDFDLLDVQAGEVAIVTHNNIPTADTWVALDASDVADLFNSSAADDDYGTLDASSANLDDEYGQTATTDELVGGNAFAVIMIENFDNEGDYKVFQVSWNGDASNDTDSTLDGVASVTLIGEVDFGTSLDGISEVNLVGSEAYAALEAGGILNI